MKKPINEQMIDSACNQACDVLIAEVLRFLLRTGISKQQIQESINATLKRSRRVRIQSAFCSISQAYEELGSVLSTWFDSPEFLESDGSPAILSLKNGPRSLQHLLRKADVSLSLSDAITLLKMSPSVSISKDAIVANRRVFVVPRFDLTRAALVVPRYLETLTTNSAAHQSNTVKLLERQCTASKIDAKLIAPILRNIKEQGTSFVDSIDGQIESSKSRRKKPRSRAQIGLLVFAWAAKPKFRRSR